jgi:hypothetical protein
MFAENICGDAQSNQLGALLCCVMQACSDRDALTPTTSVYHMSAGKGKVILCTLTSAKQSRLDREDGKKCNGTSAMLLLMMPNSTPHYIQSILLKTKVKYYNFSFLELWYILEPV